MSSSVTLLNNAREEIAALEHISYHGSPSGVYFADLAADDISDIHSLLIDLADTLDRYKQSLERISRWPAAGSAQELAKETLRDGYWIMDADVTGSRKVWVRKTDGAHNTDTERPS